MRILIIVITLFLSTVHASAQTAQEWRDSLSYLSQLIERNPKSLELRMRKAEANIALKLVDCGVLAEHAAADAFRKKVL